ncbi:AMP-binding protein, partial [Pseudomonas aeruginosa]
GAGYLPLDPNYPAERLAYMLRDSGARWLICQETLAERLPCPAEVERLPLETAAWPASADTRPLPEVAGETLAYVIYT